ncbi:SRPBCC family protein [Mucilaginibacter sp. PAMB04274]|uniref:SRPBCC family protein n=1 Tax=Mucilaginibacter sp. PAMB04274 TaxID=3138568 RepID=UPI0031F651B0
METTALRLSAEMDFKVPVQVLYKAWVTPEDLKQWWHPSENHLQNVELDIQEGGQFKYEFMGKDEQPSLTITGDYKEVKENEKLVYSWNWTVPTAEFKPSEHLLSIMFVSEGEGSRIKVVQENFQSEESINPHQEGWEKALNDLQAYLNK